MTTIQQAVSTTPSHFLTAYHLKFNYSGSKEAEVDSYLFDNVEVKFHTSVTRPYLEIFHYDNLVYHTPLPHAPKTVEEKNKILEDTLNIIIRSYIYCKVLLQDLNIISDDSQPED